MSSRPIVWLHIKCPYCLSSQAKRVAFRWNELPWLLLLRRPFRCKHCNGRFRAGIWYQYRKWPVFHPTPE
jgi:hypothetical protein